MDQEREKRSGKENKKETYGIDIGEDGNLEISEPYVNTPTWRDLPVVMDKFETGPLIHNRNIAEWIAIDHWGEGAIELLGGTVGTAWFAGVGVGLGILAVTGTHRRLPYLAQYIRNLDVFPVKEMHHQLKIVHKWAPSLSKSVNEKKHFREQVVKTLGGRRIDAVQSDFHNGRYPKWFTNRWHKWFEENPRSYIARGSIFDKGTLWGLRKELPRFENLKLSEVQPRDRSVLGGLRSFLPSFTMRRKEPAFRSLSNRLREGNAKKSGPIELEKLGSDFEKTVVPFANESALLGLTYYFVHTTLLRLSPFLGSDVFDRGPHVATWAIVSGFMMSNLGVLSIARTQIILAPMMALTLLSGNKRFSSDMEERFFREKPPPSL